MRCHACEYFVSPDHCWTDTNTVQPCPKERTCNKFEYEDSYGEIVQLERERCAKICLDRAEQLAATAEQYPSGTAACFAEEARECARRIMK